MKYINTLILAIIKELKFHDMIKKNKESHDKSSKKNKYNNTDLFN